MGFLTLGLVCVLGAAVTIDQGTPCPSVGAVSTELERLGAGLALEQVGTAELHLKAAVMQIVFRDHQGQVLGSREVSVTPDCEVRATLAAVIIAAWTGEWARTRLGTPTSPPLLTAPQSQLRPERPVLASSAPAPWRIELSVYGFGLHDGDEAAGGFGASGETVSGALLITGMVEASTARSRAIGPGLASYSFLRGGFGVGARKRWSRLFLDGAFVPLLSRLSLQGEDLQTNHHVTSSGITIDGRARVGWTGTFMTPFLFAEISRDLTRREATLDDRPQTLALSATNVALGLGISFPVRR